MGGRQDRASKGPTDRQNWAGKGDEGGYAACSMGERDFDVAQH